MVMMTRHDMVRTLVTYTFTGIGIASFITVMASAIAGFAIGGAMGSMLVRQFFVVLAVGIGFGAPAIVWTNDRLATWAKALIALVPGICIYMVAAWYMGWIPRQYGAWAIVTTVVIMLIITGIISAVCGILFRREVANMNRALKQE